MARQILVLACMVWISACQTTAESPLGLADRLKQELLASDIVIVGEKHDNRDHHRLQAEVIRVLKEQKRLGTVYMEHLDLEDEAVIHEEGPKSADEFAAATQWARSGWPDFKIFTPLFHSLVGVKLVAVGLPRKQVQGLYRDQDPRLIPDVFAKASGLSGPLADNKQKRLLKILEQSHCGYLPSSHAEKMLTIQRYRDAYMASRWQPESNGKIAVYLVGAGHANLDFGLPIYLKQAHPNIKILSINLLEEGEMTLADDYDVIIATRRADREDPCLQMKKVKRSK